MEPRVLAVDDNDDVLHIVGYAFEQGGFRFRGAHSQAEMASALSGELPDVIILDLLLPGADGYTVLEELQQDARTRAIPVIVMTARAEPLYARISADLGAARHVTKPFRPAALVAEARAVIAARGRR